MGLISGFRRGVHGIFALLGCRLVVTDVSGQPIGPFNLNLEMGPKTSV